MLHSAIAHSGNILSGNVGRVHLASGTLLIQSGDVGSGSVEGFFGDRDIASGTVGVYDFGSGAVIAGTVGSGAIVSGNVASGQVAKFHVASGGFTSGWSFGSGSIYGSLGPQSLIASGTMGSPELGSGVVLSGHLGNGSINSGSVASGLSLVRSYNGPNGDCTNVGVTAGNLSGDNCTVMGHRAMASGGVALRAIAIGSEAMIQHRGTLCIGIGLNVMPLSGAQVRDIGIGANTLLVYNLGGSNVCVGDTGMQFLVHGSGNVGVGAGSLFGMRSGESNVAVGELTSRSGIQLFKCSFFGDRTDIDNSGGSYRTVIGAESIGVADNQVVIGRSGVDTVYMPGGIASGVVLSGAIASGQVGQGHYASGSFLSGFHFTSGSVFGRLAAGPFIIASGSIDGLEIGSGALRSGNYASGSVGSFHLSSGILTSGVYIGSGTIGGQLGGTPFHISSGTIDGLNIGSGAIRSGNYASGSISHFKIAANAITSGQIGSGTLGGMLGNREVASGTVGFHDIGSGQILSGLIASGQIGQRHYASGSFLSGFHATSGFVMGRLGGGTFHIASGTIDGLEIGSGAVRSGNYASGSISHFKIEANAVRSGTLGSGSVVGSWISGLPQSIASGTIGPGDMASGTIFAGNGIKVDVRLSGISIGNVGVVPGECQLRLSLNSELAVHTSGDIIYVQTTSGRTTSGTATLFVGSGVISGLCPGMVVVGSGIPVGSFITLISGQTSLVINNNTTLSTSGGATVQFWPSAIYAMPFNGRRIALTDGTDWSGYIWISGAGSRLLMYDNRQTGNPASGLTDKLSGLTDTFQLVRGMLAVASGYIASGTTVESVDGAVNITLSANTISGGTGVAMLFLVPPSSGNAAGSSGANAVTSGANWDIFTVARSGVPWLQFGNQWTGLTARKDLLYQEQSGGVWVNSGIIN